jgi:carnitine-CoA ligase
MGLQPMDDHSVYRTLADRADSTPDDVFLVFEEESGHISQWSYSQTQQRALQTSSALRSRGVSKGDRVQVHLPNCPEFFDCWFGAAALGAVLVPTNPLLTTEELGYVIEHACCKLSITTPELADTVASVQSTGATVIAADLSGDGQGALPDVDAGDTAAVLYTSGTTSRPKGVLITHANYLHAGRVVAHHLEIERGDRWLIVLPLFHANAQYYSIMSALVAGASAAVMPRFSASRWGQQAARHRATLASLFAAPIRMVLAHPAGPEDSSNALRAVIFSQNVTESQLKEFEDRFKVPLLQLYGMTETVAPPLLNPISGPHNSMSVGRPTLGARVRIVNENGDDASAGTTGELHVWGEPGATIMAGYLDDPAATNEALQGGWLHTGDNMRAGDDGFVYFVDRAKDMIKRAGENVSASEVEAVANSHPAVFESAAIGVPDAMRDEAIKLFVVAERNVRVDDEEIISWCRRRLADFKVPTDVEFVDSLPRTSVGKIRKDVLRRQERGH